jgi:endonuclease YncB( thermonuclease family)
VYYPGDRWLLIFANETDMASKPRRKVVPRTIVGFVLIALFVIAPAHSAWGNTGVVTKVLGGDLVLIGEDFVARLAGIAAPDMSEAIGYKIYDFTKRELEGKKVKFFTWTSDNTAAGIIHDENGYSFIQIHYGKEMAVSFNEILLKKGFARVDREYLPEELKHYVDLEKEAREKGLGIWAKEP